MRAFFSPQLLWSPEAGKVLSRTPRIWRKRAVAICVAGIIGVNSIGAHAGLRDAISDMFISTSTGAQAYQSQRLNGIYGGSMTLRPVGKGIGIVQLALPKIDAGCGGIDIFFGSFSFINGEQLEQLIRSIASAAAGFAIKAAINAMCDLCGAIISELEAAVRELSSMAKNTCAIAKGTVTGNWGAMSTHVNNIASSVSIAKQKWGDQVNAWENQLANSSDENAKTAGNQGGAVGGTSTPISFTGNTVWRALKVTMSASGKGNSLETYMNEDTLGYLMMSLFGTEIVQPKAADPNDTSTPKCGDDVPDQNCTKPGESKGAILTWDQFLKPRPYFASTGDGMPVWKCVSNELCNEVTLGHMSFETWGGVEDEVNLAMFGKRTPGVPSEWDPQSIAGIIINSGEVGLSTRAQGLLAMAPFPIYSMLRQVQRQPGAVQMLANLMIPVLQSHLEYHLATEMLTIGKNIFSSQTVAEQPESFMAQLAAKEQGLSALRPKYEETGKFVNDAMQTVINVQRLTYSQIDSALGGK